MGHHLVRMIEIFQPLHLHLGLKNGTRFFMFFPKRWLFSWGKYEGFSQWFPATMVGSTSSHPRTRAQVGAGAAPWNSAGGVLLGENPADEQISYQLSQMCVSQNGGCRTQMVIFLGEDDLDMEAPDQTNPYGRSPQTSWILRLGSWPFSNLRSA